MYNNSKRINRLAPVIVAAIAATIISNDLLAAAIEEVVVTARRKSENLQNVPAAVTNFGGEALQDAGITDISGIANVTPSLVFSTANGTSVNPIIALRGQVQNDTSVISVDPSVGVYLDEVYLGRSPGSLLDMFDVARVEVLKGPQGTLYGRNTTGGAMKVIPNKANPGGEWEGFLRLMFGNNGAQHREGAINLPFADNLAGRLSYSLREKDGHGKATLVASDDPDQVVGSFDPGAKNTETYRLNLIWDLSESLQLDFGYDQSDTSTNGTPSYDQDGDKAILNPAGGIDHFERSSTDFYTFETDVATKGDAFTDGFYLKGVYDTAIGEFKAIYAERAVDFLFILDADGTNAQGVVQDARQTVSQDSFELQFSTAFWDDRIELVTGYYNFEENGRDRFYTYASEVVAAALGAPTIPTVPPGSLPLLAQNGDAFVDNLSESFFFQLSIDVLENVSFTMGARDVKESKSLDITTTDTGLANDLLGPDSNQAAILAGMQTDNCPYAPDADGVTNDGSQCRFANKTDYSYKVWTTSLDWQATEDLLLYVKKSKGVRSGGQNFRGRTADTLVPFNPEFVEDIELGLKVDLFDSRVRLNLAGYRSDYSSIQFSNVIEVSTFVENLGDAQIDGSELELTIAATDELTLIATGTLLNFEYADPAKQGAYAPAKKASLSVNYKKPFEWGEFGSAFNYSYSDELPLDNDTNAFKNNPNHKQDAVHLFGATSYVDIESIGLRIGVFGNNLTDEETVANIIPSFLDADPNTGGVTTLGNPRTYGLDFTYRFSL